LDERSLLGQLEDLARGLGIEVRYEILKREGAFTQGGLCRLKGQYLLFVNSKAANRDKIEALALAEPNVAKFMEGMTVRKIIVVPGKIVNIVAG
jgi:leucyl-tRNA synthetase